MTAWKQQILIAKIIRRTKSDSARLTPPGITELTLADFTQTRHEYPELRASRFRTRGLSAITAIDRTCINNLAVLQRPGQPVDRSLRAKVRQMH